MSVNINQYRELLKMSYEVKRPVYVSSAPGCGKSAAVHQAAEELAKDHDCKFGLIELRGSSASPAELADIKYVNNSEVLDAPQGWFVTNEKIVKGLAPKRGIIFLDELPDSMKSVQSVLQRLFLDRKLGSLTLADDWMVAAAGNRTKDKAATTGNISRALLNRCISVTLDPDPDILFDYGLKSGWDHRALAFLRFRPSCINDCLEVHRRDNQSFCSPRSLHIASDVLKAKIKLPEALMHETIVGILGDGVGNEFNGFLRIMNDLPDLDKILKDPKNYPVPTKIDVAWATIGALSNRVNKKNMQAIMQYFVRLSTELSVVAIKDLAKIERDIFTTPEFVKWSSSNIKFAV